MDKAEFLFEKMAEEFRDVKFSDTLKATATVGALSTAIPWTAFATGMVADGGPYRGAKGFARLAKNLAMVVPVNAIGSAIPGALLGALAAVPAHELRKRDIL